MSRYYLYYTSGCHLCDLAEEVIRCLSPTLSLQYEKVDIANEEKLVALYGVRIPVLKNQGSGRELGWPFTEDDLQTWLNPI